MVYKCYDDNGYNAEKCEKFITNYKNCKKFWVNIIKEY